MEQGFKIAVYAFNLLVAVVVHEVAHGYVALKLGDNTAQSKGRITLNPIKHIDPFMTIILPAMLLISKSPILFGGAKPVPVNPMNFKKPIQHMGLVALAGPVSNFTLAILYGLLLKTMLFFDGFKVFLNSESPFSELIIGFTLGGILINIFLGLFNLIPIPPLDGGRIVASVLPKTLLPFWYKLERFGIVIVFAFFYYSGQSGDVLGKVAKFLFGLIGYFIEI